MVKPQSNNPCIMTSNYVVIIIVLLCILLVNSTLLFKSASDISELQRLNEVGCQKLVLFATTGFSTSSRGKLMMKSFSEYIESINGTDDLTGVVNIDFNDEMKLLNLPSRGVLSLFTYYVDNIHFQGGDNKKLIADLSVYFEQIVRHYCNIATDKKRAKVIMILGARSQQTEENVLKIRKLLQNSIAEAWSLVPKILLDKLHNIDDYLEIKLMDENPDNLVALVKDVTENNNFMVESTIINHIYTQNNRVLTNTESFDIYDMNIANDIFLSGFTSKINEIHLNDTVSMDQTNMHLDSLNSLASDYNINTKLNELLSSSSLQSLRTRARLGLLTILYPFYIDVVQAIRLNTINSFDIAIKVIKPNARLLQNLDSLVHEYVKRFDDNMQHLKHKFEKIINISSNNGIFTNQSKLSKDRVQGILCYKNELKTLHEKLVSYSTDRQIFLFTQGVYNPYIRDKPYPPFRINLSYLFNPKSVLFNFDYNKMYDEHKEGPVLNRADTLLIPGIAKFPFDPNDRAIPKENRKWYQILVDLYLD